MQTLCHRDPDRSNDVPYGPETWPAYTAAYRNIAVERRGDMPSIHPKHLAKK
jgi:hypothetical protein